MMTPSTLWKADENGLKRSHSIKFNQMHYLLLKFGEDSRRNKNPLKRDPVNGD